MSVMWSVFFFVICYLATTFGNENINRHQVELFLREYAKQCYQTTPNCQDCLSESQCAWCTDGIAPKCIVKELCSRNGSASECLHAQPMLDNGFVMRPLAYQNSPPFIGNSSHGSHCSARSNCSSCTGLQGCSWCESKKICFSYFGDSNASQVCGSELWYKNQCLYSSTTKPCPQRTGGCKECLSDKLCYWCKSSGNCSFLPYDNYVAPDCSTGDIYHESCSHVKFWQVLVPILTLILSPILVFLIILVFIQFMKKMGWDNDEEEKDGAPKESSQPEKKKPSMKLSHKPSESRVNELKKKYNLGD